MATRQLTVHVVECDICGQPFERDDMVIHFDNATEGITYVTSAGWTPIEDGRLICRNSDFLHDLARIPEVAA